jgi:tensin
VEEASWYQPRLSRHLAVKILADCPVGSFVVRQSQTHSGEGCLALTVRVPRALAASAFSPVLHYLVLVTEEGFRIKGFAKVFPSLAGLVVHHSVMKESLPCRLLIENDGSSGGGSGGESDRESDFADLDSDPEYPGLIVRLREQFSQ